MHGPAYNLQFPQDLVLPVLQGRSPYPDQLAFLFSRLKATGIDSAAYKAFLKWRDSDIKDINAYYMEGEGFSPRSHESRRARSQNR